MNRDQILQMLENIDDRFVTEAARFDPVGRRSPTERSRHMKTKRIVTLALAAALLLGLGAVACAAGWIGPRAIAIEDAPPAYTVEKQEDGSVVTTDNPQGGWVSLTGPQALPEDLDPAVREKVESSRAAWAEWKDYLSQNSWEAAVPAVFVFPEGADSSGVEDNLDGTYTVVFKGDAGLIEERTATQAEVDAYGEIMDAYMRYETKYDFNYNCHSDRDEQKLEEIAARYGLQLRGNSTLLWSGETIRASEDWANAANGTDFHGSYTGPQYLSNEELAHRIAAECCHGDFFRQTPPGFDKFYYFDEGSFGLSWYVVFTPQRRVTCYLYNASYGTLTSGREVKSMTDDLNAFAERSHTCPDGTVLTVLQSPSRSYFYVYLEDSYLCGDLDGGLSESEVDAVLDSIFWSNIGK